MRKHYIQPKAYLFWPPSTKRNDSNFAKEELMVNNTWKLLLQNRTEVKFHAPESYTLKLHNAEERWVTSERKLPN